MTALAALQRRFQAAVLHGERAFERDVEGNARADARRRIGIYEEAYRLRLAKTLADNYPGLVRLLGERRFEELAGRYIARHPSSFRSVRWFGDRLPEFLAAEEECRERPWVEMARADWAMTLAFDAADEACVGEQAMTAFAPQQWGALTFRLHPSVQRLDLEWSVLPFRRAVRDDAPEVEAPQRSESPRAWLIWRRALDVHFRCMDVDEAWALDAARRGETFAALCAGLTEWVDEGHAAERAASFLKRWLLDELIVEVGL